MATPVRLRNTEALMDAAEQLLYEVGYAGVSTRRVAEAAGVKHGLVHYYFGSMDELLTQTLERFADRFVGGLEALYSDPTVPIAEKWRLGAEFLVEEPTARFPKILLELAAMSWNVPPLRERVAAVHGRFQDAVERHVRIEMRARGVDETKYPPVAVAALIISFQLGLIVERLTDSYAGHAELLGAIQTWFDGLDAPGE
jgi:TetR/AcrR family transcriptional regulator